MNNTFNPENKKTHYVYIKRNGKTYVYEGYTFYDKQSKKPLNKRRYLGILNEETKEIKPKTNTIEKLVLVKKDASYGTFYVLDMITKQLNLKNILELAFLDKANEILTLAYGIACEGSNLYLLPKWQEETYNPYLNKILTSQRISELLKKISFGKMNIFFEEWIKNIKDNEYLAYDITSISSYSKQIERVELGYNRDKENLPQINLGLLYGEESQIPLYYQIFNGSIKDVRTIEQLLVGLHDMNIKKCKFVMDKGFYSSVNNSYLYDNNHIFTIAVPFTGSWAKKILEENKEINDPEYYSSLHKCYYKQIEYQQGNRTLNIHIYYDTVRKANEETELNIKIQNIKESLEKVKRQQETPLLVKYTSEEIGHIKVQYGTYYDIEEREIEIKDKTKQKIKGQTIDYKLNKEKVQKALKTKGYLLIITNDYSKTSEEILTLYRNKEVAENAFDDIKNEIDLNRLNIHSDDAMNGKIFLVFLSLIYISYIRKALRKAKLTKEYTYKEVIKELRKIKIYTYENNHQTITPISAAQKKILSALSITENEIRETILNQ